MANSQTRRLFRPTVGDETTGQGHAPADDERERREISSVAMLDADPVERGVALLEPGAIVANISGEATLLDSQPADLLQWAHP
jgi:hypothetical protein